MVGTTPGVERGCGYREQGAVYLECGLDEDGEPIESFLIDPPTEFEVDAHIGQELIDVNGTTHVFDWIGSSHYEYTADFIEEIRHYGLSRRISRNLEVSRLTPASRILCLHARAYIPGYEENEQMGEHEMNHPKRRCGKYHQDGDETHLEYPTGACSRKWWWDAEPTTEGTQTRSVASFSYGPVHGWDVPEPEGAIFLSLPITNFAVIMAEDGSHMDTTDDLRERTGDALPVINSEA